MILHIVRLLFVLSVLAISSSYATTEEVQRPVLDPDTGEQIGLSPVTKVVLVILVPFALAVGVMLADVAIQNKSLGAISGLFFGVVAGTVLAYILVMVVDLGAGVFIPGHVELSKSAPAARSPAVKPVPATAPAVGATPDAAAKKEVARPRSGLVSMIKLLVGAFTIYICVSLVLQTKDDFRFIIPYVEFAREQRGVRPMLLDTSVIIDGRIADIAETRILESELIVPRFVLEEIQEIADSSDKLRRNRGRRGLDMLNRLQTNDKINIRLMDVHVGPVEEAAGVDQKLVALAEHLGARVVTNDYNLNKIAKLRGVDVVNINDLANALKPVFLPGETLSVRIIKPGEEVGQGVGYLDDGTMVVAEQGRDFIGREMTIVVTSVLQTSAGRMIFGRPEGDQPARPRRT